MQRALGAFASRSLRSLSSECSSAASWGLARHYSAADGSSSIPPSDGSVAPAKPIKRKKLSKKERFGRYDQEFDDEMAQIPVDESIEHLYDTRPIVEKWMGHPTFYDMISEDALANGEGSEGDPPGEGPILRWETRVVLGPGGDGFHPANRKVKVSVYVKELELSASQRERLLALVGKRYNPNKDELTIVSERFEAREENRKDVLRTLLAVIEEAKKSDQALAT